MFQVNLLAASEWGFILLVVLFPLGVGDLTQRD